VHVAVGVDVGVVWLDAHGDVHTVESSTSGYPGGMPLRILSGHRPARYPVPVGLTVVDEDRLVLVDARDLDPAEHDYLTSSQVRQVGVTELNADGLPAGPLVLHIDLDVVDSAEIAALRYPVTPGPSSSEVLAAARRVMATGRVVALDLAATWDPTGGATPAAGAALLADLLGLVRGRAS
jgi:arginase